MKNYFNFIYILIFIIIIFSANAADSLKHEKEKIITEDYEIDKAKNPFSEILKTLEKANQKNEAQLIDDNVVNAILKEFKEEKKSVSKDTIYVFEEKNNQSKFSSTENPPQSEKNLLEQGKTIEDMNYDNKKNVPLQSQKNVIRNIYQQKKTDNIKLLPSRRFFVDNSGKEYIEPAENNKLKKNNSEIEQNKPKFDKNLIQSENPKKLVAGSDLENLNKDSKQTLDYNDVKEKMNDTEIYERKKNLKFWRIPLIILIGILAL